MTRTLGQTGAEDPGEPPIGEIEDDFDDIDAMDGVEAEIDLDFPIEEQN